MHTLYVLLEYSDSIMSSKRTRMVVRMIACNLQCTSFTIPQVSAIISRDTGYRCKLYFLLDYVYVLSISLLSTTWLNNWRLQHWSIVVYCCNVKTSPADNLSVLKLFTIDLRSSLARAVQAHDQSSIEFCNGMIIIAWCAYHSEHACANVKWCPVMNLMLQEGICTKVKRSASDT